MTKYYIITRKLRALVCSRVVNLIYRVAIYPFKTLSAYQRADAFVRENFKQQAVLNASV